MPQKAFADLCGRPVVAHVVERALQIVGCDRVILAVPEADGPRFKALGLGCDVLAYTSCSAQWEADGHLPEDDVLSRFGAVSREYPADFYARITADCPLLDPRVCEKVIKAGIESGVYTSNDVSRSGYPDGLDCEVFPRELLLRADREVADFYARHHVCPWMADQGEVLVCVGAEHWHPDKISVDTPEDLERVRRILEGSK